MSDWKKRNDDWRDEDELEEEEECECPWVDSKGKVRETAYCQYLLEKHPMMCLKQKLFDQNGEVDEDALLYEVHSDLRDFVLDNLAKKEKQVLDALRIETYTPEWKPQLDRIHLQNGTYFLDERGFVPEKELCLNLGKRAFCGTAFTVRRRICCALPLKMILSALLLIIRIMRRRRGFTRYKAALSCIWT